MGVFFRKYRTTYLTLQTILKIYVFFMMKKLKFVVAAATLLVSGSMMAGGLLTNTNHNITFNRNFARDGAIGIDGVYSNPAGVAFLGKGLHMSFNIQNVYQTRTILSGMTVYKPSFLSMSDEAWQQTPYSHPFVMYGGDEQGVKEFKGKSTVPILPSFQIAKNYDKWGIQVGFALNGGGGKCTFNEGLASFERTIAMIPALLYTQGISTSGAPGYSVSSYLKGQQYVFGLQLGGTYKINEHLAAYAGFRFNYVFNKYKGNITNISANINGESQNLYNYFGERAEQAQQAAMIYQTQADMATDPAVKAQAAAAAEQYQQAYQKLDATRPMFADRYLDCTQNGWGITPIIGFDAKFGKWNFGTRLEFTTHFNIENDTKRDDTGLFKHGVNTPSDLPGIWTIGAQYEILPTWRVMGGYHLFFDKNAEMADNKQKKLSGNTQEFLLGTEWDVTKKITVSCGGQRTKYGLGDGSYLSDMSFVTSSYSFGFGAKVNIMKNVDLNIAYFFTDYSHKKKEYDQTLEAGGMQVQVHNTDDFTRTNKVLGVGVDIHI